MHSSISLTILEKSAARMEGAIRGKLKFINSLKVITYRGGVIYNGTGLDLFTCIHPFGHNQLNGIPLGQPAGIGSIADRSAAGAVEGRADRRDSVPADGRSRSQYGNQL